MLRIPALRLAGVAVVLLALAGIDRLSLAVPGSPPRNEHHWSGTGQPPPPAPPNGNYFKFIRLYTTWSSMPQTPELPSFPVWLFQYSGVHPAEARLILQYYLAYLDRLG